MVRVRDRVRFKFVLRNVVVVKRDQTEMTPKSHDPHLSKEPISYR